MDRCQNCIINRKRYIQFHHHDLQNTTFNKFMSLRVPYRHECHPFSTLTYNFTDHNYNHNTIILPQNTVSNKQSNYLHQILTIPSRVASWHLPHDRNIPTCLGYVAGTLHLPHVWRLVGDILSHDHVLGKQ